MNFVLETGGLVAAAVVATTVVENDRVGLV